MEQYFEKNFIELNGTGGFKRIGDYLAGDQASVPFSLFCEETGKFADPVITGRGNSKKILWSDDKKSLEITSEIVYEPETKVISRRDTLRKVFNKFIGITADYTRGDRVIAWGVFFYSFVYKFLICFVLVVIWNVFIFRWSIRGWGTYFFITTLLIPGIVAGVSTFWFGIGGAIDLFRLFRDLEHRKVDILDNGLVEGNVSLADKERFARLEAEHKAKQQKK